MKMCREVTQRFKQALLRDPATTKGIIDADTMFINRFTPDVIVINVPSCADLCASLGVLGTDTGDVLLQAAMVPVSYEGHLVPVILLSVEDTGMRGEIPLNIFLEGYLVHELTHAWQLQKLGLEKYNQLAARSFSGVEYKNNILEKEAFDNQIRFYNSMGYSIQFMY